MQCNHAEPLDMRCSTRACAARPTTACASHQYTTHDHLHAPTPQAEDGSVQQLKMSPGEFRGVVSLLEGALEGEEEELPE